jgi:2',3'-cyclic-nucleotide 2'-phosphodiesterase (5'-nucleotidase family)
MLVVLVVLFSQFATSAGAAPKALPASSVTFTILHTNDFHGQLEWKSGGSSSNPGMARLAAVVNGVRTAVGSDKVLVLDVGDEMQGSLLSNIQKGKPTLAVLKWLVYG